MNNYPRRFNIWGTGRNQCTESCNIIEYNVRCSRVFSSIITYIRLTELETHGSSDSLFCKIGTFLCKQYILILNVFWSTRQLRLGSTYIVHHIFGCSSFGILQGTTNTTEPIAHFKCNISFGKYLWRQIDHALSGTRYLTSIKYLSIIS